MPNGSNSHFTTGFLGSSSTGFSIGLNTLVSDEDLIIIQWIFFAVVSQAVSLFGTASNIINIICFIKQGCKDPATVSFLGLAISDLGCLLTLIWMNICYTPTFTKANLSFDPIEVTYVTVGMVHVSFTRITCWITAFITLERCLCITMPLKVGLILNPKRTVVIIVLIFVLILASPAPVYSVNRLGLKFFPDRNKTLIGLVFAGDRDRVESISFIINNWLVPSVAFIVIVTCTITLVVKLHSKNKWRMKSTTSVQTDHISTRNQAVAKMVLVISILFLTCYIPLSIVFLVMSTEPSFAVNGKNWNMLLSVGAIGVVLGGINSSGNIFVYYHMSSKFREVFRGHFFNKSTWISIQGVQFS